MVFALNAGGRPTLLDELGQFLRLSPNELQAYQYLMANGSATPSAVARETGQSRGRTCEILRVAAIGSVGNTHRRLY